MGLVSAVTIIMLMRQNFDQYGLSSFRQPFRLDILGGCFWEVQLY